jgi:cobalt-zinc-cadmium efflux system protein
MTLTTNRSKGLNLSTLRPCYCGTLCSEQSEHKVRAITLALLLLSGLFATELTIGTYSHSLSLVADAGHLLCDMAALGITLTAAWLAQRPPDERSTFGHRRIEILAALINGLFLLAVAAFIIWESVDRFHSPQTILGLPMLTGAIVALAVNSCNLVLLHQRNSKDLNRKAAFLHVVADAASSVGVIIASLTIYFWHWMWMDATASLMVAGLTGLSAIPLLKESLEILLEYAPKEIVPAEIEASLSLFAEVKQIENLRIWSITSGQVALSAHLQVTESIDSQHRDRLLKKLQTHLHQTFQIQEITLQLNAEKSNERPDLHPIFTPSLTKHVLKQSLGEMMSAVTSIPG